MSTATPSVLRDTATGRVRLSPNAALGRFRAHE
jgi:hypothetical protein